MLTVSHLRYLHFGPFDFEVAARECLGLTGPSGAGKTRLLRSLADLDPHDGVVSLEGEDAASIRAPLWRGRVGYLPAESRWWGDHVGTHFRTDAGDDGTVSLEALGFGEDVRAWEVQRLSTGERQRLALYRLLLNRPRVVLLDEPTSALDEANAERVERLVRAYREASGAAVLWVAHDVAQLERVASRVLCLADGRLESRP